MRALLVRAAPLLKRWQVEGFHTEPTRQRAATCVLLTTPCAASPIAFLHQQISLPCLCLPSMLIVRRHGSSLHHLIYDDVMKKVAMPNCFPAWMPMLRHNLLCHCAAGCAGCMLLPALLLIAFAGTGSLPRMLLGCGPVAHADGERPRSRDLTDCVPRPPHQMLWGEAHHCQVIALIRLLSLACHRQGQPLPESQAPGLDEKLQQLATLPAREKKHIVKCALHITFPRHASTPAPVSCSWVASKCAWRWQTRCQPPMVSVERKLASPFLRFFLCLSLPWGFRCL